MTEEDYSLCSTSPPSENTWPAAALWCSDREGAAEGRESAAGVYTRGIVCIHAVSSQHIIARNLLSCLSVFTAHKMLLFQPHSSGNMDEIGREAASTDTIEKLWKAVVHICCRRDGWGEIHVYSPKLCWRGCPLL